MIQGIIFILIITFCLIGLFFYQNILFDLKQHHRQSWENLGSPHIVFNNSLLTSKNANRFFLKKEYLKLEDARLAKKCIFYSYFLGAYLIFFAVAIVLLVRSFR